MQLVHQIQQRLVQPGESDTRVTQRRLGAVLLLIAAASNIPHALFLNAIGLPTVGLAYLVLAVVFVIIFALNFLFPRLYDLPNVLSFLAILATNLAAQYFSGGYTSGTEVFVWILSIPVFIALFSSRRPVVILIIAFALTIAVAAVMEPAARAQMPQIDPFWATVEASINFTWLGLILLASGLYLFRQVERYRSQANNLLLNILPAPIATRLLQESKTIADGYDDVTVLFADIVDFTTMSADADPVDVVNKLNDIFSDFDALAEKHSLEKIKTIGDAYMVAGGLPDPQPDHCRAVAAFAVDMLGVIERHRSWTGEPIGLRIGINCGPVVAGVIGRQKFIYDLWGDAVNVASRMESNGLANQIQVTEAVKERLEGHYAFTPRAPRPIKGKGMMVTYLLQPSG